jgi:hypothetical protein
MCSRHTYALVCLHPALTGQIGIRSAPTEPSLQKKFLVFSSASSLSAKPNQLSSVPSGFFLHSRAAAPTSGFLLVSLSGMTRHQRRSYATTISRRVIPDEG